MDDRGKCRLNFTVIDISQFKNLRLHGGFIIKDIELADAPMVDAIGREAVAQTSAIAREFRLFIRSGLSVEELSITLYHEILEAASVALADPPASVMDFNEADLSAPPVTRTGAGATPRPPISITCCNSTGFGENKSMVDLNLRLTEPQSGLSLEKKLAPADAVVRQKATLLRAFEAALVRVELAAA